MAELNVAALETYLAPISEILAMDGINEVMVNEAGGVWIEKKGDHTYQPIPEFTFQHLLSMGRLIAQSTSQEISFERPILSATLPNGYRVQVLFPPAVEQGTCAFAIRKPGALQLNLDTYEKLGSFDNVKFEHQKGEYEDQLWDLFKKKDIKAFLKLAVIARKNIIVSGGTSTGKTTFANAVYQEIPHEERLITVEDAREIILPQPNRLHLLASKGGQGLAKVTTQDLIEACLRLAPSRIIVGELRGAEAFSYLRAVNTGHPGSIATLHADTPALAIEQLCMMVLQAGMGMTKEEIKNYVKQVVEVVVQLKKGPGGRRYVSELYFDPTEG
jgi:type IV secretion system protein VirB11